VLVDDLNRLGLWDAGMLEEMKYYDGSLQNIGRIPLEIRQRYLTSFELEPKWLIECAARRQKWIDQGQSLNLYLAEPSGRKMHDMYFLAWDKGLKTTYYLRTLAATQVEKSTVDVNRFGIQPKWMKNKSASSDVEVHRDGEPVEMTDAAVPQAGAMCPIDDPGCESCQ
jgi:ribonucleoside-diphosphate reductase alpha chain